MCARLWAAHKRSGFPITSEPPRSDRRILENREVLNGSFPPHARQPRASRVRRGRNHDRRRLPVSPREKGRRGRRARCQQQQARHRDVGDDAPRRTHARSSVIDRPSAQAESHAATSIWARIAATARSCARCRGNSRFYARIYIIGGGAFVPAARKLYAAKDGRVRQRGCRRSRRSRRETWRRRTNGSPNWNARLASNRLNSIFFGKPCGESGERARGLPGLACQGLRGHPSDDALTAARRIHDRAGLRAGGGEPRRLLP